MQFYGISSMHPYKQSGQWYDVLDVSIEHTWKHVEDTIIKLNH